MVRELGRFEMKEAEEQLLLAERVDKARMKEYTETLLQELEVLAGRSFDSMNEFYGALSGEFIVRREYPTRLLRALVEGEDLQMLFDSSDHKPYSNSVIWNQQNGSRGIENAFLEGFSNMNGVVLVAGYRRGADMKLQTLEDANRIVPDYGTGVIDRTLVRSLSGTVHPGDISFVIARIPRDYLSEEQLTEREIEHDVRQVFRGFIFESAQEERLAAK